MSKNLENEDLERFSGKEIRKFKILVIASIIVMLCAVVSILLYLTVRYSTKKKLSYCQDTGLYRTISNNEITSYSFDNSEVVNKSDKIESIGRELAQDIALCISGKEFSTNVDYTSDSISVINNLIEELDYDSPLNLSELFPEAELQVYGDGEHVYYPEKIEGSVRYSREWLTESSMNLLGYSDNDITKTDAIPDRVVNDLGPNVIGYIEYRDDMSMYLDDKIYTKDNHFFINIEDLHVEGTDSYINYFGEKHIDLLNLEPTKSLRLLNPGDRFTWIMTTSEVKGNWCYIYFSNKYSDDLSVVSVKVSSDKVTDVKIQGFES